MKRGEIWTSSGGGDYAGKPRPVVVLQADVFGDLNSVTICPITTNPREAPLFRIAVHPTPENGLERASMIMADRITTVRRERLAEQIGVLDAPAMMRLAEAIAAFLELREQEP